MNKKSLATVVILLTTALFASGQEESSPINTVYADLQMLSRAENRDGGLPESADENSDHSAFVTGRAQRTAFSCRPAAWPWLSLSVSPRILNYRW
jgi:hypothetical protein